MTDCHVLLSSDIFKIQLLINQELCCKINLFLFSCDLNFCQFWGNVSRHLNIMSKENKIFNLRYKILKKNLHQFIFISYSCAHATGNHPDTVTAKP